MKRFLFAAVATCLCAGLLQSAEAGNRGGNGGIRISNGGGNRVVVQNHNVQQNFQQNHNVQNFQKQNFQKQVFHNQNFQKKIVIAAPQFDRSHLKFQNYHLTYGKKFNFGY